MKSANTRLRRVSVGGLAVVAGASLALTALAVPANAAWDAAGTAPTTPATHIGIVPKVTSDNAAANVGGALLVQPGKSKQAIDGIRLLVPNSAFTSGDVLDLYLYSRSDTETGGAFRSVGTANTNAATALGFDSLPTVTVNATPLDPSVTVGYGTNNTESVNGPKALAAPAAGKVMPTTAPQFTATLAHTGRAQYQGQTDIIRLTANNQATLNSDPNALWEVTLTGLTVNVGTDVTPGALRVAPFAYNKAGAFDPAGTYPFSQLANGANAPFGTPQQPFNADAPLATLDANNQVQPAAGYRAQITTYTVPAYVAPATIQSAAPSGIVADGTAQPLGNVTITETSNIGLQPGVTYTLTINGGAQIANAATDPVKLAVSSQTPAVPAANVDTISSLTATPGTNVITFQITSNGTDPSHSGVRYTNETKDVLTLSNLKLSSGTVGPITYTLSGGSVDQFLSQAGTSPAIGGADASIAPYGAYGVGPDSSFAAGVNQALIQAPVLTTAAGSATSPNNRIGGLDRYDTARKIAERTYGNARNVVIASGENFPDALAASYLAGSLNAPILLTQKDSIPQSTLNGLRELRTDHVYVVGGPGAISDAVVNQLRNTRTYVGGSNTSGQANLEVTVLAGANRYETAKVANIYGSANSLYAQAVATTDFKYGDPAKRTALVVSGENFPDALAAGGLADGNRYPMVLTSGSALSPEAQATLTQLGIQQVVIVGGTGAVSSAVESSIGGLGMAVKRVSGADRYATATALADLEAVPWTPTPTKDGGFGFVNGTPTTVLLATGENFADALVGSALSGQQGYPIVLTASAALTQTTGTWLTANGVTGTNLYNQVQALGLAGAVSESALTAANAAIAK